MSPYRDPAAIVVARLASGPSLVARLWRRLQRRWLRKLIAERGTWRSRHLRCERCAGPIRWADVDVRDTNPWEHKGGCYARQMLNRGWGPNGATVERIRVEQGMPALLPPRKPPPPRRPPPPADNMSRAALPIRTPANETAKVKW